MEKVIVENKLYENLLCPISLGLLIDPITLPCCGNSVSKQEMLNCWNNNKNCPMCRADLSLADPDQIPINKNLAYLVEEASLKGEVIQNPEKIENSKKKKWKATIHKITNNSPIDCTLGYLNIKCHDPKYKFKTLLIPVIDESGSMSGYPTQQVKYSLQRIVDLTFQNRNMITYMIGYSDNAKSYIVDPQIQRAEYYYKEVVEKFGRGGGTNFSSAFQAIVDCLKIYKENIDITSVVVVFLTDGEDSTRSNRTELVNKLKTNIEETWKIQYTVHSIGFGSHHDYDFLNRLRLIGTIEGAYRYADPKEDNDSLSKKIFSIIEVIAETTSIPIEVIDSNDIKIIAGDSGQYWLDLSNKNCSQDFSFTILINKKEEIYLTTEFAEDENDKEIWEKWLTYLVDNIATELLEILNKYVSKQALECQLHLELLTQRSKAILTKLEEGSANFSRINTLLEKIKTVQSGGKIDEKIINNLKFDGKFAIQPQKEVTKSINNLHQSAFSQVNKPTKIPWISIRKCAIDYSNKSLYKEEVYVKIRDKEYDKTKTWALEESKNYCNTYDDDGNSPVHFAAYVGRFGMLESFIKSNDFDISLKNKKGFTPLDMALLNGFYISAEILIANGAKFNQDPIGILMTCITNGYKKTVELLIKNKLVYVSEELADSAPTNSDQMWLKNKVGISLPIEAAIVKGAIDFVTEKLISITEQISWKPLLQIFNKPNSDQIKVVELLLKNKKVDPNEIIEVDVLNNEGLYEKEIIWPLFCCCEKGNIDLFQILINYVDLSTINMQNLKGTTCLWIACCNNKIDIVLELLNLGADPNICNSKGDSPLIPCCQKGLASIINILLETGLKIDSFNKNRDSPVIICCRTGQNKILEILLNSLKTKEEVMTQLNLKAQIDGFNALISAAEVEKADCIKMCHKYGADLEFRTDDDNCILPGATALHLACFYGKLISAQTLVELGADIKSLTNTTGMTPLHLAVKQGHSSIARFLLSKPAGRECLLIKDKEEKTPGYYATMTGNEEIYDEFFRNKLAELILKICHKRNDEVEQECTNLLLKYGQSLLCYTYQDIVDIKYENGSSVLSEALITGNNFLAEKLIVMGADVNKKDNYAISPAFWMMFFDYKGVNSSNIEVSAIELYNNVIELFTSNLQYKVFFKKQPYKGQLHDILNKCPMGLMKMYDGFSYKISKESLSCISKEANGKILSIMGFIDGFGNNKNFPDGKKCLEMLLWEGKIHVVKILSSNFINKKLNPVHIFTIYLYTANLYIFQQINYNLINWKNDCFLKPFIFCLYQAISNVDNFVGEVYRCVDAKFELNDYKLNDTLIWPIFSFASTEWKSANELINSKKGIIFIIQSKTGRNISNYSKIPADKDIVFLPETKFRVINHFVASVIALGQANIRKSTFTAKEKDFLKAEKSESSIIVELEEIDDTAMTNILDK